MTAMYDAISTLLLTVLDKYGITMVTHHKQLPLPFIFVISFEI